MMSTIITADDNTKLYGYWYPEDLGMRRVRMDTKYTGSMTRDNRRRGGIHKCVTGRTNSMPHHVIVAKSHFEQTYSFSSSRSCQQDLESPASGVVINRLTSSI